MSYDTVLDTPYETGLRMLLLLHVVNHSATCDYLAALDTLVVNAKTLGVGDVNLNGTHRFAAGEIGRRVVLIGIALRDLSLRGLVGYDLTKSGVYVLTDDGHNVANAMSTTYAKRFSWMAQKVVSQFRNATDVSLIAYITERTTESGIR